MRKIQVKVCLFFLYQIDIEVITWQGLFDVNPHFPHLAKDCFFFRPLNGKVFY